MWNVVSFYTGGGGGGGGGGQFTLMTYMYTSFVTYRCQLNSELTRRPRVCSSPRIDVPTINVLELYRSVFIFSFITYMKYKTTHNPTHLRLFLEYPSHSPQWYHSLHPEQSIIFLLSIGIQKISILSC